MEKEKVVNNYIVLKQVTSKEDYINSFHKFEIEADWNPCNTNPDCLDETQKYYYIGIIGEKPIFSFLFHCYEKENLCYFSIYYTIPEFRGKGLVYPHFTKVYEEIKNKYSTILWSGAEQMIDKYNQRMGAKVYGWIKNYIGTRDVKAKNISNHFLIKNREFVKEKFKEFLEYDLKTAGYDRSSILSKYLNIIDVNFVCSVDSDNENKINGIGIIRTNQIGYLIGPVSGDSEEIILNITSTLYNTMKPGEKFNLLIPLLDSDGEEVCDRKDKMFVEIYNLSLGSRFALQGTNTFPNDFKRNYLLHMLDHSF